jgi:putative ABC transport system ATP-binding protein
VTVATIKPQPIYELHGISKTYEQGANEIHAVRDVELTIDEGEFLVVVGPSGSGKTTLLQLLGGLDRPTAGEIKFEGRDMTRLKDGDLSDLRLRTLGFIFQQFNLIPTLTAAQNVEVALAPRKLTAHARHDRARRLLESVGLAARAHHVPSKLSGGEQSRSRAQSRTSRVFCSPTSRPGTSIRRRARRSSSCSGRCRRSAGRRSS